MVTIDIPDDLVDRLARLDRLDDITKNLDIRVNEINDGLMNLQESVDGYWGDLRAQFASAVERMKNDAAMAVVTTLDEQKKRSRSDLSPSMKRFQEMINP